MPVSPTPLSPEAVLEKLQCLRGMVDLLPEQMAVWQWVEATARHHFSRAGVQEIRTPVVELTDLFARSIGEATDVVGKEMYSFADRSGRHCSLRPEGTASVVRAAIQHGLLTQSVARLWYGGPMFRYERPQAGRQRQFHQIGLEVLGCSDVGSDLEAIALAWDLLEALGLQGLALQINSLGTREDRLRYRQQLVEWLEQRFELLDPDSQQRLRLNPLRILDSKVPSTQALLQDAPSLSQSMSSSSLERFEAVQQGLAALGIACQHNPRLVRGLDYYSHTAFEITTDQLGAQATVCGGGRYNGLVEQLGGPPTAAIGWALGMERLVLLLQQQHAKPIPAAEVDLYLIHRGEAEAVAAVGLARQLRRQGLHVLVDFSGAAFGKQFKRADRSGAKWAGVIGEQELAQGCLQLKPLRDSEADQVECSLSDLTGLMNHVQPAAPRGL